MERRCEAPLWPGDTGSCILPAKRAATRKCIPCGGTRRISICEECEYDIVKTGQRVLVCSVCRIPLIISHIEEL